jgi:hypothetical protein
MALAFVALLAALGGTAVALPGKNSVKKDDIARGAVGNSDIARNAVTARKVKNRSITGRKRRLNAVGGGAVKESSLGKVPSAGSADTANSANVANNANNANNANTLGGAPPSAFLAARRFVSTNGIRKLSEGSGVVTIAEAGPFKVTANCTDAGANTSLDIGITSSEADSALNGGGPGTADPFTTGVGGSAFTHRVNENLNIAAPSGAALNLVIQYGVKGLGADCFVSADGFLSP